MASGSTWVASASAPPAGAGRTHVVRKGETLHAIARRFGCGVPAVAQANGLHPPRYAIRAGQRLRVPSCRA
ncbi:MAG: LysM peptidoglycan-binding domain-containing protein [Rhodanobacteraceae bacterium]|nr:LysM peptidoglycan-binding domain-containing protein [Rhodanobacteraceae bacterium]